MAQAAMVAVTLGTAAYGAYSQQRAAKEQQRLSNRNADLLDDQADDALRRGEQEVHAVRRRTRNLVGNQRVQAAAQGLDVNSGAAFDLQTGSMVQGAIDEAQVQQNAFDEAWGIRTQSSNQRLGGRYARRAGTNQAIGTVLGSIGDSARTYQQFRPQIQGAA